MKNIIFIIMIIFIGSILLLYSVQSKDNKKEEEKKGMVTYKDGQVKKRVSQNVDWVNAEVDTPVHSGDRMRTYKSSRAELELLQLDIIRMAPETTIDIVKLYEETKSKIKETNITLEQGDIWAKLGKKDATMKFDISTPVAGAAITGTVFRMGVKTDSTTELRVYRGEVRISNVPEKVGLTPQIIGKPQEVPGPHEVPGPYEVTLEEWVYIVKSMQKIVIGSNGQVMNTGNFSLKDKDEQTDWVKWNLERDRIGK